MMQQQRRQQAHVDVLTESDTDPRGGLFGNELVVTADESSQWLAWEGAKEAWLANLESDRTRESYEASVAQFFVWAGVAPWQVGSALSRQWKAWMRREGKIVKRNPDTGGQAPWELNAALLSDRVRWETEDGRVIVRDPERREYERVVEMGPLADSSINVKLAALSSFYTYAQEYSTVTPDGQWYYLWPPDRQNPFQIVKRSKVPQFGRAEFPTTDEMRNILGEINTESLGGKRDYALLYTYVVTCKRFSEIINIQWGDIWELANGDYGFRFEYKGRKGKGKTSKGVLPRACFRVICEYLRADGRPSETMAGDDYLFVPLHPDRAGRFPGMAGVELDPNRPISNKTANKMLKKYARRAGVDERKAHIHSLRHSGARQRAEQMKEKTGHVDYGVVQDVLGHANINTSMIYSKNVLEDPDDPGGKAAAEAWLVTRKRRRKGKGPGAEQIEMDL